MHQMQNWVFEIQISWFEKWPEQQFMALQGCMSRRCFITLIEFRHLTARSDCAEEINQIFDCSYGFLDASFLHQGLFVFLSSYVLLSDRGITEYFKESKAHPHDTHASHENAMTVESIRARSHCSLKGVILVCRILWLTESRYKNSLYWLLSIENRSTIDCSVCVR